MTEQTVPAEPTPARPQLPLDRWREWARRDDWHRLFVGSDIRQLIGEIDHCRAMLAAAPPSDTPKERERQDGAGVIERCLAKAAAADPADAPIPLVGEEAALWHQAQAEAYRHALEMMGPPAHLHPGGDRG
jgi:hypothetical protein